MNYRTLLIATVAVIAAFFLLRGCFSGAEGQIRKQLTELEELVSFEASEGDLSSLTKAKRLGSLFAEDVRIELSGLGMRTRVVQGRTQVQQAALAARKRVSELEASLHDVTIELADDQQSAVVEATGRAKVAGEGGSEVQDFVFIFNKTDDGWLIAEVKTSQALR